MSRRRAVEFPEREFMIVVVRSKESCAKQKRTAAGVQSFPIWAEMHFYYYKINQSNRLFMKHHLTPVWEQHSSPSTVHVASALFAQRNNIKEHTSWNSNLAAYGMVS